MIGVILYNRCSFMMVAAGTASLTCKREESESDSVSVS